MRNATDQETWTKANALLGHLHLTEWEPGDFESALFEAMLHADRSNLDKLTWAFPAEGLMVRLYRETGPDAVRSIANLEN